VAAESDRQLLATLRLPEEIPAAGLGGWRIELRSGDRTFGEARSDSGGKFLLELADADAEYVELLLFDPSDVLSSRLTMTGSELAGSAPLELTVHPWSEEVVAPSSVETLDFPSFVDEARLERLGRALDDVIEAALVTETAAAWIENDLSELKHFLSVVDGASFASPRDLDALQELLRDAPMWQLPEGYQPFPEPLGPFGECFVAPVNPYTIIVAGLGLSLTLGGSGWPERAAGYFLARVVGLHAVEAAASKLARGDLTPTGFAAAVGRWAPPDGPRASERAGLRRQPSGNMRERLSGVGRPMGSFAPPLPLPPRPLPSIDDLDWCSLEWMNCAYFFMQSWPGVVQTEPSRIGSVEPSAVCEGYTGGLTLRPRDGEDFGPTAPAGWVLSVGLTPLPIVNWAPELIEVEFPEDVPAGCSSIGWTLDVTEMAEVVNEMRAACQRFLGRGGSVSGVLHRDDVDLSVVGEAKIVRFTAGGEASELIAEGCTQVMLEWDVEADICRGTAAALRVAILADGVEISSGLSSGSLSVSAAADVTYRLRAETTALGATCATVQRDVRVRRYQVVRALAAGEVFGVGSSVPVTARISCPAPAGGVSVTLTSTRPARFPTTAVMIPMGSAQATAMINAGAECGDVSVQATAPGHQATSLEFFVGDAPTISAMTPSQAGACTPFELCLTALCAGRRREQTRVVLERAGQTTEAPITSVQLMNPAEASRGPNKICAAVPTLVPGDYAVGVSYYGRKGVAGAPLRLLPLAPTIASFTVQPPEFLACTFPQVTLRWDVTNAAEVKIFRDGNQILQRSRTVSCAAWQDSFVDPTALSRDTTYRLDAIGAGGGPTKSTSVTVPERFPVAPAASATFKNNWAPSASDARSLYLWSVPWQIFDGSVAVLEALLDPQEQETVVFANCQLARIRVEATGDERVALFNQYPGWAYEWSFLGRTGSFTPFYSIY
jgi:hypothetical protein